MLVTRGSGSLPRTWRRPSSSTGRTSRSSTSSWAATRRRADGHAGQGGVERLGEHQPLRADRGAGRDVRDLREVSVTDVAVVGFAQSPCGIREDATTSGVEMLVPIFAEVFGATGLTRADIGFWCSGSSDYLAGRAFSFVSAVDAIGAVPQTMESHVEMDGAWALYEAWVKILTGEAEIALAYGFGKSSGAELRRVLALQLDPYLLAPLWPDSVSIAALQARLGLEAGRWTEKDMAEVAARSRAAAVGNPRAQRSGEVAADELLGRPYVAEPLRAHDCAPVGDGAAVVIIASAERARDLCARPARRAYRARPRLRRRLPVLLDVGGVKHAALGRSRAVSSLRWSYRVNGRNPKHVPEC